MKNKYAGKILALVLAFAMVLTGASASMIAGQAASAAKKVKVTLKLSKSTLKLQKGKKATLKITKKNVSKIKSQKWTTSKKSVATVSKKGVVTAKNAGKATIKCKVTYIAKGTKKAKTKTLSCKVTVNTAVSPNPAPTQRPAPSYKTYDDKSNVGPAREVTIVGGTSGKMTVKDNGTVRKELSAQDLADWYMGLGVNLGNTMEAMNFSARKTATSTSVFETNWGQPITTQKYIDCVHSYGINTLRIPVAWSNMVNDDTYEINEKYLGRVEEIVNYALNDGMYVIINIHYDNGWWGQFGACKRLADNTRVADEEKRAKAWARFESYWKQISERFKNYSDHLIFEGGNEELGSRLNEPLYQNGYASPDDPADTTPVSGNLKKDEQYETANKINQLFVDTVRASGGNNKYRHLLIPGIDTNIANTADARFKMPTDIAENGKSKLFVSVHFYDPWNFCGDNSTGDYTEADRAKLPESFSKLKRHVDEGYAVIIGECGVCEPAGVQGDVVQWYKDTYAEAQKYHAVPVLWEKGMYFNRGEATLKWKDIAELWNETTGAKGDTSMTGLTGKKNAPAIDVIKLTDDMKPVWSWTGKWYKNGGDNVVGDDRYEEGGGTTVVTTDADHASKFVPESKTEPTIEGDTTSIEFNDWGYHAFIKLDLSKYKKLAIAFKYLAGTGNEGNVGTMKFAAVTGIKDEKEDFTADYWDVTEDKAVVITENIGLSAEKPYFHITFGGKPTIVGINIYELGE